MDKFKVPFNKPFIVGHELYYIAQAVMSGHLSGDGYFTKRCHDWLIKNMGAAGTFLTHSCTASLEMAALLCDVERGDEIIMPSFTFVSTANAFVLRGGVPVFVDIRPDTLNMDETLIERAVTTRTRVIVPVHYAGIACEMDKIFEIAEKFNLFIVEDAAQAFFSKYKGRYLGTLGHLGCFSFHETKNIISGEGGALLVNDKNLVERAEILREKGTNRNKFSRGEVDKYTWVDIGSSYLPSELVGAFLYAQMEQVEKIIAARCRVFDLYNELLRPLQEKEIIRLPSLGNNCTSNGHIYYIITRSLEERTRLIAHLQEEGIKAVFHYVPLHSSPAGMKFGRVASEMNVTDTMSERVLRLPMYYEMSDEDVITVTKSIQNFYNE